MDLEEMQPQTAAMGTFFDLELLLTYQNVLVIIAAWGTIEALKKAFPKFWRGDLLPGVGPRLLVLMPMIVCQALVWGTVKWQPDASVGERVLLGLVLAFLTAHAHDVLKRFGLHEYIPILGTKLKPKDDEQATPEESKDDKSPE